MTPSAERSLDPIFSPRSIAVIGASRDRSSIGYALLHNLIFGEFNGAIFPVNPKASVVHSLKAYPSVGAIPDPVDLAVVAVPRDLVPGVVRECIDKGVRGLVVITAGFAETGERGAALERELVELVEAAGIRMIGPNCMGVINSDPEVSMDATFAPVRARRGSIGFVSQSGALGVAILIAAADLGIGLTQFASMGNKADVTGNDLLEHWEHDDATRVICMYLESFGDPRRVTAIAKRIGRVKPILMVKSGRTEEGARAASSHTGAIAGADVTVSTFLDHCGVLRANTINELFDMARAFDRCPPPGGDRVGIVTNAGGPAIMATDACVNLGLEIAELSEATRDTLARHLPAEASVANPVDMIASADPQAYRHTLAAVLADPQVDMVLAINVTPLLTRPIDVIDAIGETAAGSHKPVLAVMMAEEDFYEEIKGRSDLPPVYRFPESAARALAQLRSYAAWRERPLDPAPPEFEVDDEEVARRLATVAEGQLAAEDAYRVLELYGIPVAGRRSAADAEAAVAAAEELGYPVALKAEAEDLVHKSDVGGVRLGLEDATAVREAARGIEEALAREGLRFEGFLVQEMLAGGHEVIFGLSTDPRFGPLLMFGLGGRYVEVINDVRFGVIPLTEAEADEMIRGIRGYPILEGIRGEAGADLALLREVQMRIAQLAQRHPRIVELDVNPFLAAPDRANAKALDVRIRVAPAE
ncbi:MAG: acetate--CoA ligase family protein [Thermoanaerobaculia bacterium]|nr:acetate--CoA ligase family protein [Thermoanaerobaculia bacterium]